jgi:peptidoglycan/xylan/chitin deacetylase (PgdA/CDA1 family)
MTSGGAILCFHSITTAKLPAAGEAHLSLEHIKSCIHVGRRIGELVPLSDVINRHINGRSTSGLIAVTFDDAYAALAGEFRDFISKEAIPITVFVVTASAEVGATYWWDRVDDAFAQASPDAWWNFEVACGLPDSYRRGQPKEFGPLRPLRQWLLAAFKGRWPADLEPALKALEASAGTRTRQRSMTFDEIAELSTIPSVQIGVHTVTHPVMPLLSDADLLDEIAGSHETLRQRFPNTLRVLAIPFGLYDERTIRASRAAGMTAALTLAGNVLRGPSGQHALSRLCVTRQDSPAGLAMRLLGLPALMRACSGRQAAPYPHLPSPTT